MRGHRDTGMDRAAAGQSRAVQCCAVPSRAEPCRPAVGGPCRAALRYKAAPQQRWPRDAMCAPRCLFLPLLLFLLLLPLLAAPSPAVAPSGRPRVRRGLTYPGTLWCGAGSNADSYEQLGEHRDTDRCCRDHDHCQHVIHPFTSRYGYRNLRWHTISHCDCDRRLKECLQQVNDTASRVVGQAFFNVIQVPCFEFAYKEECVQPYLYVWCRAYNTVAVAVPKEPVLYEFGGELIDRAAWPGGEPLDLPAVKVRKRMKEKRKKGKGLKKSPSGIRELNHAASVTPIPPNSGGQDSRKRRRKERNRKKRLKSNTEAA
ncbi:protein PROCA1 [Phasianus colchicus]|uniref:protein PROCA1 n=1 Tax=Phasianus colchicus TaxID=9054 RepID=UPI00129E6F5A|nr:protein PROCA1 [Phasianus colchicus]